MRKRGKMMLFLTTWLALVPFMAMSAGPMPDTGQTRCYNLIGEIPCPACPHPASQPFCGQDAQFQPRLPRTYTKLGAGGKVLSSDALPAEHGGEWLMTRDEITGLIWENKTMDCSIHNKNLTYLWTEASSIFIRSLNTDRYGLFDDWRLPTVKELASLLNSGIPWFENPTIDSFYFPNTVDASYWSQTPYRPRTTTTAWFVNFYSGIVHYDLKLKTLHVRAVRGDVALSQIVDNGDGTVTDTASGLMWTRCNAGQVWDGIACSGTATPLDWELALAHPLGLEVAGYSDWRLPNRNELQSLADYAVSGPSIDTLLNKNTEKGYYWTSTSLSHNPAYAWRIGFDFGDVGAARKVQTGQVRAVRYGRTLTFGSLTVNIQPPDVVTAGAQWRRAGTHHWLDSGFREENVPAGIYFVEYKNVTGWDRPPAVAVTVNTGFNLNITGTYLRLPAFGSLTLYLYDEAGNPAAAEWRRVGTPIWYPSGALEANIPAGVYDVEFSHLPGTITVTVH